MNSQGTTSQSAVEQLKKLRNEICITKYSKDELPDEVLEAFATIVLDTISDANIDEYETNQTKLATQIYKQINAGIQSGSKEITLGKGSKKITYTVNFSIMSSSFIGEAAQVSYAEVSWKDKKNKPYSAYITASTSEKGMKQALASYCAVLAQLNKGLWKDFLVQYFTDGWNLADLNTVMTIDDNTVSKYFDHCEKLILAMNGDKKAKEAFLAEVDGELKEKLSKMSKKQFQEFIKKNVPNGGKLIEAAKKYKKIYDKYNDCKNKYKIWEKSKKNKDIIIYEEAYEACRTLLSELDEML